MTRLEQLIGLARIARAAFERVAQKHNYNDDLGGLCYDASCFLARLAAAHGIEVEIGHGFAHWFVLLDDMVVDVTATQFGVKEKISVLPLEEAHKRGEWWHLQSRSQERVSWSCAITKTAEEAAEALGIGVGEAEL